VEDRSLCCEPQLPGELLLAASLDLHMLQNLGRREARLLDQVPGRDAGWAGHPPPFKHVCIVHIRLYSSCIIINLASKVKQTSPPGETSVQLAEQSCKTPLF